MKQRRPEGAIPPGPIDVKVSEQVYVVTAGIEECTARGYPYLDNARVRILLEIKHPSEGWVYVTTLETEYLSSNGIPISDLNAEI